MPVKDTMSTIIKGNVPDSHVLSKCFEFHFETSHMAIHTHADAHRTHVLTESLLIVKVHMKDHKMKYSKLYKQTNKDWS